MITNAKFLLGLALVGLVAAGIGIYAYGQSREYIRGPRIVVNQPEDGSVFSAAPIVVAGGTQNVAYITLDGAPIFVDSKGNFREKLLLLPGYNILTIEARDRFGRKVEKTLELVYNEMEN
ncbi:MAG: hypothetical protein HYV67_03635 [Candidatus Taylorbacteria bacterium]|nr:hypothetical protein [Candidatus Taylorbacteria bacterium]